MKFFAIDQHVSGMLDIKRIFASLGHTLDDICLSGHHWVAGREKDSVPGLDGDSWCGFVDREFWHEFHATYKDQLDKYDGFICFYPPLFSYLYQNFKKPIICQFPIRYEYPCQSDAKAWEHFNQYLRDGVDNGMIHLCANNPYDAVYGETFIGRSVRFVPSLCEYTDAKWHPQTDHVLYYSWGAITDLDPDVFLRKYDTLPTGHSWADVGAFKACAHFPYNVSTMSIMEQYAMHMPMIFPSLDFAVELYKRKFRLFEQSTWCGTFGREPRSVVTPAGGFPQGYDPNNFKDVESLRYWLQYADYYSKESMQGLIYYSSIDELNHIAKQGMGFFDNASDQMKIYWPKRRERAMDGWRRIIEDIRL